MNAVRKMFPGRLISRFGDLNIYLWENLKSRVYESKSRTLNEIKDAIRAEISLIDEAFSVFIQTF